MKTTETNNQEWDLYWEVFFENLDESQEDLFWESVNIEFNHIEQKGGKNEKGN